jgi:hypothetical protein
MSSDGMSCCEHAAMNWVMLLVCLNPSSRWLMRVMVPEQYFFINLKRSNIKQHNSRSNCQDLLAEYNAISKGLAEELPFSLFPNTRSSLIKGCKRTSTASAHSFCASLRARCAGAFRDSLHRSEVAARITSRCSGVEGEILREAVEIMQACAEKVI